MASQSSDEQTGQHADPDVTAGTEGESTEKFGQRMESSEAQAEQYTDAQDTDPDSGAAAQKRAGTAPIPSMVTSLAEGFDGDADR